MDPDAVDDLAQELLARRVAFDMASAKEMAATQLKQEAAERAEERRAGRDPRKRARKQRTVLV